MKKQPDIHYEGEITVEFIDDLLSKIRVAVHFLENQEIHLPQRDQTRWEDCKYNWLEILKYAAIRCVAIQVKLEHGMESHRADEDHKCIDITLCVLRDFENAKLKNFIISEEK